jgi:uncharacterized membrane protein
LIASFLALAKNFPAVLTWGMLIGIFVFAGRATWHIALAITAPLIGHATWHAYRALAAPAQSPD